MKPGAGRIAWFVFAERNSMFVPGARSRARTLTYSPRIVQKYRFEGAKLSASLPLSVETGIARPGQVA
jgi:hypothetical protein